MLDFYKVFRSGERSLCILLLTVLLAVSWTGCGSSEAPAGGKNEASAEGDQKESSEAQEGSAGDQKDTAEVQEGSAGDQKESSEVQEGSAGNQEESSEVQESTEKDDAGLSEKDRMEVVFFDVGKGDCILVSMGEDHVLIDAGYEETWKAVTGELRDRGVETLDAMIITHYDKDHVGGAAEIAQEIPVDTFYLPDYIGEEDKCGDLLDMIEADRLQAVRVDRTVEISLQDVEIRVNSSLIPYDPEEKNDNDASLIVEILYGEDEWLLPGDIEKDAIEAWLGSRTETYDVLKLPHHGKKKKNTKDLIDTVQPEIAVITDSSEEDASEKVLKKLQESNVTVYRSSVNGTIEISGDGEEDYVVHTEKQ